jgi:hypothetical protein
VRAAFHKLFRIQSNGALVPKLPIQIGAKVLLPGIAVPRGYLISGIDLAMHIGDDLEVELKEDRYLLKKFIGKDKPASGT